MLLTYQKKGPVSYTIQGSLTLSGGVVSGFSSSNFLKTSAAFPGSTVTDFEAQFHFPHGLDTSVDFFRTTGGGEAKAYRIGINSEGALMFYSTTKQYYTTTNVAASPYLKVISLNNFSSVIMSGSNDGVNWTDFTVDSSSASLEAVDGIMDICYDAPNTTLDLNKTYIKVNGQVWFGVCPVEVQHVNYATSVGYVKVGNPTITNNVITYASSSNYLNFSAAFPSFANNDIDIVIKRSVRGRYFMSYLDGTNNIAMQETSGGAFQLNINGTNEMLMYNSGNYSYIRFHKDREGKTTLSAGNDGVNWSINSSKDGISYPTFSRYKFVDYLGTNGAVYLDETYIKLNGKLWFACLPVQSVTCNGTTVWSAL